jgi:hypothetical protein
MHIRNISTSRKVPFPAREMRDSESMTNLEVINFIRIIMEGVANSNLKWKEEALKISRMNWLKNLVFIYM